MNFANALGFIGVGIALAVAPVAAPGLFPHTAIDGSSTRALWVEVVGAAQIGLGLISLCGRYAARRFAFSAPPAREPASLEIDAGVIVVERVATPEAEGSVVLHGEHAELWRALNQALRHHGHARQLAAGLVQLAHAHSPAAEGGDNVVAFGAAAHKQTAAAA